MVVSCDASDRDARCAVLGGRLSLRTVSIGMRRRLGDAFERAAPLSARSRPLGTYPLCFRKSWPLDAYRWSLGSWRVSLGVRPMGTCQAAAAGGGWSSRARCAGERGIDERGEELRHTLGTIVLWVMTVPRAHAGQRWLHRPARVVVGRGQSCVLRSSWAEGLVHEHPGCHHTNVRGPLSLPRSPWLAIGRPPRPKLGWFSDRLFRRSLCRELVPDNRCSDSTRERVQSRVPLFGLSSDGGN